jgi:hypothetical protein
MVKKLEVIKKAVGKHDSESKLKSALSVLSSTNTMKYGPLQSTSSVTAANEIAAGPASATNASASTTTMPFALSASASATRNALAHMQHMANETKEILA